MTETAKNLFSELDGLRKDNERLVESRDNIMGALFKLISSTEKDELRTLETAEARSAWRNAKALKEEMLNEV